MSVCTFPMTNFKNFSPDSSLIKIKKNPLRLSTSSIIFLKELLPDEIMLTKITVDTSALKSIAFFGWLTDKRTD